MKFSFFKHFHKKQTVAITYEQVLLYLERHDTQPLLAQAVVKFLRNLANDNGENLIKQRTIGHITNTSWRLTEAELEAVYQSAPVDINHYVEDVLCSVHAPSERDVTKDTKHYSKHAQQAHIFLSECSNRVIYGVLYEPKAEWLRQVWSHEHDRHANAI